MNIYIIGRGAIGKALAVFLKLNNQDVVLIRGSVNDATDHPENIRVTMNDGSVLEAVVDVTTINNIKELNGIVVLTSKSFGNKDLAKTLKSKISDSPLVILQNGLGVEQPFIDHDFPSVYRCVLFVTSQNIEGGVRFKPVSVCPVGVVKGNFYGLKKITTTLTTEHFQFKTENNIELIVWKKAIINCAFNSICPLLEVDNGIFHRDANALELAKRVIRECLLVASKKGIELNADAVIENLLLISKSSDGNLISTLQDIRNGQPTEIDTLNFEIARLAASFNIEQQVQQTRILGELTKLKSEIARTSRAMTASTNG
jgi:2-dehydropantoate 2-reductase